MKSKRGIAFRRWANNVLKQYIINGYALNEKRLDALQKTVDIQTRILAGATVDLHRMAVADTFAIDRYLDENCLVEPEKTSRKESVREMKKRNKDVEKIKRLVAEGSKRWVRYDEGAILYSVGIHTFQKLAKDARACYKVGGVTLIDTQKLDKFIEAFEMEDDD